MNSIQRERSKTTIGAIDEREDLHYVAFMDDAASASRKASKAVSGSIIGAMKQMMDESTVNKKVVLEGVLERRRMGFYWSKKFAVLTGDGTLKLSDKADTSPTHTLSIGEGSCEVRAHHEGGGRFQVITRQKDYTFRAVSSGDDSLVSQPSAEDWIAAWRGLQYTSCSRPRAATMPGVGSTTTGATYVVRAIDTIEGIAMAHGVTPAWLKRHNGRSVEFREGQTILVPAAVDFEPSEINSCESLPSSPGEASPPPTWSPNVIDYQPTAISPSEPISYEPVEIAPPAGNKVKRALKQGSKGRLEAALAKIENLRVSTTAHVAIAPEAA